MKHFILFTGHMIDAKDRKEPRFHPQKEKAVRQEIRKQLLREKDEDNLVGIAGGACGGDILFHELCAELDIPSQMYLALPVDEYKQASVSFAGKNWDKRFEKLKETLPIHLLPEEKSNSNKQNIWERTNLWMLDTALKSGGENMTLLALWDGKGGDGKGGTEHMVQIAKEQKAKICIIDINII
jgi:hypothetical protein